MAPLFARLEESISKINGKLGSGKRRNSEEEPASEQLYKQARKYPDASQHQSVLRSSSDAIPSLFPETLQQRATRSLEHPPDFPPTTLQHQYYNWNTTGQSEFHPSPGSSFTNPIDLTTPPTSPSSHTSRGTMTDDVQMRGDEAIARALQEGFTNEVLDQQDAFYDTSDEFGAVFDPTAFGKHLREMRCAKCRNRMPISWDKIVIRTTSCLMDQNKPSIFRSNGQRLLHPYLQCAKCKLWSCCGLGCKKYLESDMVERTIHFSSPELQVAWCCDAGRLFLIFSLACGPEPPSKVPVPIPGPSLRSRAKAASEPSPTSEHGKYGKGKPSNPGSVKIGAPKGGLNPTKWRYGKEPESKLSKGIGYGGDYSASRSRTESSPRKVSDRAQALNGKIEQYLRVLAALLPSYSRDEATAFDYCRQPAVAFILDRSPVLIKLTELLRQNSVQEMSSYLTLYSGILEFLDAMAGHTDIIPVLYQDQVCYPRTQQLPYLTFERAFAGRDQPDSSRLEKTQSLDTLMQRLSEHCRYFVRAASAHIEHFTAKEEQALLLLAKRIVESAEKLDMGRETALASLPDSAETTQTGSEFAAREPSSNVVTRANSRKAAKEAEVAAHSKAKSEATAWHRENCLKDMPDDKILESFSFQTEANKIAKETSKFAPNRMKKLVQQISSLQSDLPEGIYVRHGASRLDVIKVLIVGPQGTPYENGLFEFDMLCTSEFPRSPPLMNFRTTGGGTVRFNPNLYACGKVCLSLLGTWQGQSWDADKSTILQILISIQGMILNDQPWYNEPGREYHLDDKQAKQYNQVIWAHTLEHAILHWLNQRLAAPSGSSRKHQSSNVEPSMSLSDINDKPPNHHMPMNELSWSASWTPQVFHGPMHALATTTEAAGTTTKAPKTTYQASTMAPHTLGAQSAVAFPPNSLAAHGADTTPDLLPNGTAFNTSPFDTDLLSEYVAGSMEPNWLIEDFLVGQYEFLEHQQVNQSEPFPTPQMLEEMKAKMKQLMEQSKENGKTPVSAFAEAVVKVADPHYTPVIMEFIEENKHQVMEISKASAVAQAMEDAKAFVSKKPVGNTSVDGTDNNVWGEVIRLHFTQGRAILENAKASPHFHKNGTILVKRLEGALKELGFV